MLFEFSGIFQKVNVLEKGEISADIFCLIKALYGDAFKEDLNLHFVFSQRWEIWKGRLPGISLGERLGQQTDLRRWSPFAEGRKNLLK